MSAPDNHVVFSAFMISPRQQKFAVWLRKRGWRVTMLTVQGSEDRGDYFDNICYFTNLRDLLVTAKYLAPRLYHCFCPSNDYLIAETLINYKVGPIVCDIYDQINYVWRDDNMRPDWLLKSAEKEKFCIENATGLCARDLMLTLYKRNQAFPTGKPVLYFPEYCWGLDLPLLPKRRHQDGRVHFALAGSTWDYATWQPLVTLLLGFGFVLHVYPFYNGKVHGSYERYFAPYIALAQENPNFQLHAPVHGPALITEFSQYDICPISDLPKLFDNCYRYTDQAFLRWTGNKMADCFEAGVYYLGDAPQLNTWLARRFGVGSGCSWDDLQNPAFWQALVGRLDQLDFTRARQVWSMERNIDRLIGFYERMAAA
jgi:hypothetical protein